MFHPRLHRLASRRGQFSLGGLGNCASAGTWPCCASDKICVTACGGKPLDGATINLRTGSTTGPIVATGTTDSTGCWSPAPSGTYYVEVVYGGYSLYNASRTVSGTLSIAVSGSSIICCAGYVIPASLTLTDVVGSIVFNYSSGASGTYPTWLGCVSVDRLSVTVTAPCTPGTPTVQPMAVCYQMLCVGGSPPFRLQRSWGYIPGAGSGGSDIWYSQANLGAPCSTALASTGCSPDPPVPCGSPLDDTALDYATPSSSSPFAISFTMADQPSNTTADPIGSGDTVAVSA